MGVIIGLYKGYIGYRCYFYTVSEWCFTGSTGGGSLDLFPHLP